MQRYGRGIRRQYQQRLRKSVRKVSKQGRREVVRRVRPVKTNIVWGGAPVTHVQFLGFTANPEFWLDNPHFSVGQLHHLADVERKYKGRVFRVDRLPKGFYVTRAFGSDFILNYRHEDMETLAFRRPITTLKSGGLYDLLTRSKKIMSRDEVEQEHPTPPKGKITREHVEKMKLKDEYGRIKRILKELRAELKHPKPGTDKAYLKNIIKQQEDRLRELAEN